MNNTQQCSTAFNDEPFAKGYNSVFNVCKALDIRSAAETLAFPVPTVRPLWPPFWYEGEISVLFAESNVGKSILAMQIARDIAAGDNSIVEIDVMPRQVLYIDYELSVAQYQSRYRGAEMPPLLHRATPSANAYTELDADTAFDDIIAAMASGYKTVVVDNMTFVCDRISDPGKTLMLMKRLKESATAYGASLLLVCHTPKRNPRLPLSKADIAGSSNIVNFADSAFAIGQSRLDPSIRYLKQIKVREGRLEFNTGNVLAGTFKTIHNFLTFIPVTTQDENLHLQN